MAQKFLTSIDLTKNELQNAVIQNLASAPSSPVDGQIYYNTTDDALYVWDVTGGVWVTWLRTTQKGAASGVASLDGATLVVQDPANAVTTPAANKIPKADGSNKIDNGWLKTGTGNGLDADKLDGQEGAFYLDRANHTSTQLAATISNFDTQVRTNRLDQMAVPTADVSFNSKKITNLLDPTNVQDAATKNYVDNVASGVDVKGSVRAATTANITRSAPQTIDGVAVIAGERVLVKNQTAPAENGIFVVAAGAWARATDMDTWAEVPGSFTFVEEGTVHADTAWVATADAGGTLNTTAIPWSQFAGPGSVTASNQGTGIGVYDTKVGNDLQFRNVKAGSIKLSVTLVTKDIVVDIVEANLSHANIGGVTAIANGGTGAITAALARTALGVPGKFAASVGNGVLTSITVNHLLGTTDVVVMVKETAGGLAQVFPDVVVTDANNVTVLFTIAPTTNQYRVIVIG